MRRRKLSRAQAMTEYALILVLIVIVAFGMIKLAGARTYDVFSNIENHLIVVGNSTPYPSATPTPTPHPTPTPTPCYFHCH